MRFFGREITRIRTRYGRVYAPAGDEVIGRSLKLYGEWAEPEIAYLSSFARDGEGAIIDVGANIGTHSLAFSVRFPKTTVISLEPQPLSFALLCANLMSNGCSNVEPHNIAAGSRRATVDVDVEYEDVSNLGAMKLQRGARAQGIRQIDTLDHLCASRDVQLLKIDVEGMEADVLLGARDLIGRSRPTVYFEALSAEVVRGCRRALHGLDYSMFWLSTDPFNPQNYNRHGERIWARNELGVLCLPNERAVTIDLEPVSHPLAELPAS